MNPLTRTELLKLFELYNLGWKHAVDGRISNDMHLKSHCYRWGVADALSVRWGSCY